MICWIFLEETIEWLFLERDKLNDVESVSDYRIMRVKETHERKKQVLLILIDYGSTHSFMDVAVGA